MTMGDHECPECLRPAFFGVPHECRGLLRANVLPSANLVYWDDADVMTMHEWCAPDTPPVIHARRDWFARGSTERFGAMLLGWLIVVAVLVTLAFR